MAYHEEYNGNEIFVGNISSGALAEKEIKHLRENGIKCRVGSLAYDIHGKKLSTNYMLPLFIKKESSIDYDNLMMEELRKIRMS